MRNISTPPRWNACPLQGYLPALNSSVPICETGWREKDSCLVESKLFGIIQILWNSWKLLYLVTCIFLPRAFTCCTMSIMSRARFAILTACFEHLVGKPLTAMYLSPTVSTCYTNIFTNQYINILLVKIDWSHLTSFLHLKVLMLQPDQYYVLVQKISIPNPWKVTVKYCTKGKRYNVCI